LVLLHQGKRTLINVTVGRGFKALDLLVLFHQGKRTTITALIACLRQADEWGASVQAVDQGFIGLDSTFGRQVFGSF
jgi:hypothetical protein